MAPATRRLRIHAAALHYFDAVRRAGSIREAARRLNVASSAVNRQVLALEAELGEAVFERLPAGLKLTAAGEVVARHVIGLLRDAERVQSELDALRGLRAGHVELVTLEGLCHRIVPAAIAAMTRQHPRVTVGVSIAGTEEIPRAVADGDVHLGLAFEVRPRPELRQIAASDFPVGAVVPAGSPLAAREWITAGDLRDVPLVLPKDNFANRAQLHPLLQRAGVTGRARHQAGSIELMKQLVLRGMGAALMTRVGLEAELEAGHLVHVPLRQGRLALSSRLGLYARSHSPLPIAGEVLAHEIAQALEGTDPAGA